MRWCMVYDVVVQYGQFLVQILMAEVNHPKSEDFMVESDLPVSGRITPVDK